MLTINLTEMWLYSQLPPSTCGSYNKQAELTTDLNFNIFINDTIFGLPSQKLISKALIIRFCSLGKFLICQKILMITYDLKNRK